MFTSAALHSLIFDCEVALPTDDGAQAGLNENNCDAYHVGQRLEALCRPSCPFARELRCRIQWILLANFDQDCQDVQFLGRCLASSGYLVAVRTALSGSGADCFKSLRHEFLVVRGTGEYRGMEFIVEPSLRQHFLIPHPSPDYDFVLSRTPDVFVGGSCRLMPVVQLLCALMADSFHRQGLPLPPWRREAAMLSKWLPQPHRARDTPVLPPPAAAAAAAAMAFPTPAADPVDDMAELAAAALSRGYLLPEPPQPPSDQADLAGVFFDPSATAEPGVFRTDSDASTDSCDGFAGCAPYDCSPVSVLRLLPGPAGAAADASTGVARPPMPPAALAAAGKAPAVQRGFEPPSAVQRRGQAAAAVAAAAAGGSGEVAPKGAASGCAAARGAAAPAEGRREERRRSSSTNGSSCCFGISGSGVDSGVESSTGRTSGLLSAQMQERQRPPAVGDSGGDGGDVGRIRTRPPVHRGEMAIRVVKLVGFAIPDSLSAAPAAAPLQQQQQLQQSSQQQRPPPQERPRSESQLELHSRQSAASAADRRDDTSVVSLTPSASAAAVATAAAAGSGAGVPWRRELRLSLKL